jgi:mevalonate kinase
LTLASAPGKVILFGEHAVVSGILGLGSAVDLRARVRVENLPGGLEIETNLPLTGFSLDLLGGRIRSKEALYATRYVSAVLEELGAADLHIKVESEIPPGAGLGSSAAIVVAALAALSSHLGLGLSREEIAALAHRIEKKVQKGLGSPMDTALATFGGYLQVSSQVQKVDLPELALVIGHTGIPHDTRAEVEKVQSLRARYPDLVDPIFGAIGLISEKAVILIKELKLDELGELMNINHGLLEALGVGTRELSELVYAARGVGGALGAKITGAGGGGCIIALPGPAGGPTLEVALRQAGARVFHVRTGSEGVRLEA